MRKYLFALMNGVFFFICEHAIQLLGSISLLILFLKESSDAVLPLLVPRGILPLQESVVCKCKKT